MSHIMRKVFSFSIELNPVKVKTTFKMGTAIDRMRKLIRKGWNIPGLDSPNLECKQADKIRLKHGWLIAE